MAWDGVRRIIWAKNFDEMEIIGTIHFSLGVPIEADPEFKAMVLAAGVTHSAGNNSIDNVLKSHRERFLSRFEPERTCPPGSIKELLIKVRRDAIALANRVSAAELTGIENVGVAAAANALIRSQATFIASIQLINNGLGIEAEAVIRQGLEQVAWSLCVLNAAEAGMVLNSKPSASINGLKDAFPGAGAIYGMLSESAHLMPRAHGRFVNYDDDGVVITIRDPDECGMPALMLVVLLDAYLFVASKILPRKTLCDMSSCDVLVSEYKGALPPSAAAIFSKWRGSAK